MKLFPICFMLPGWCDCPIGGYKVVYEYANRLVALGYPVTIAYAYREKFLTYFWLRCLRHPIGYLKQFLNYRKSKRHWSAQVTWFAIDKRVRLDLPQWYSPRWARTFPPETRFVATFIWTAMCLNQFSTSHKNYLIQDFENWGEWTIKDVEQTYKFPGISKIAISKWLADAVAKTGDTATLIPNGLDFDTFGIDIPIEDRNCFELAAMWHYDKRKRSADLLSALQLVKMKHPHIHVTVFCAVEQKEPLPEWIDFVYRPSKKCQRQIYNKAAIFVNASQQEGWGLTPCEAMQCGAAVACTDIGGHRSFAKNGETALMSEPLNPKALANNISRLIKNNELRIRIAKAGNRNIQQFTWERAVSAFRAVLTGANGRALLTRHSEHGG